LLAKAATTVYDVAIKNKRAPVKKTPIYRDKGAIFSSLKARRLFDTVTEELQCLYAL
jgi:hypothetical protein